jgi:hypothetical protein
MTLTLSGRLQTRLVLLSTIGVLWTLVVSPPLAWVTDVSLRLAYRVTLETAVAVMLLGLAWDPFYHGMQQFRWDKDWPSSLYLVTFFSEAVPVWLTLHALKLVPGEWGFSSPILPLFAAHLGTTWTLVWLVVQGPLRVVVPRWRFEGGTFSRRTNPDLVIPFAATSAGMAIAIAVLWIVW